MLVALVQSARADCNVARSALGEPISALVSPDLLAESVVTTTLALSALEAGARGLLTSGTVTTGGSVEIDGAMFEDAARLGESGCDDASGAVEELGDLASA